MTITDQIEVRRAIGVLDQAIIEANPPNPCSGARMAQGLSLAGDRATEARNILARLVDIQEV